MLKRFFIAFIFGIFLGILISVIIFRSLLICPICKYEPVSLSEDQALPLTDQQYFYTVNNLLLSANKSVHIIMFEIKYYPDYPESNENRILEALIEVKRRGVDVKIVTDEYLTDHETFNYLKSNGLDIKFDSPNRTTHSKIIIIDGKVVVVGSTNWSYYAIDKNREVNVIIYSEHVAQQFEKYFEEVWQNL